MRIGELERLTGVPRRLLRYYEEQGLLHPERDSSGYRVYTGEQVALVGRIRELLAAGLNTETIRGLLPCAPDAEPGFIPCSRSLEPLNANLMEMDAQIAALVHRRERLAGLKDATEARLERQRA
ncbi:MerR family transcriptional regulator [Glycomyces algeriensis]|uniref:MerR family transcriptional regulator n=1 Tax=Glycomyces algeriensis TaxID=256037 RepID=A0A9W6G6U6_9ACTN|nr:MerR family transcriptional regulator [Glycomyces algeriensis]MDA1369090.1 MerR family transcriptional regulator [Glycomyces algeriensis]MDR7348613.1 DNA-binding transcriptional MerR regulator [Glycomyces algeriensis]GLI41318.1 MerR family transcriptional regulator [Glycomyces algeriensis]